MAWVANGQTVSGTADRAYPSITSDGAGGAIVAFDYNYDVFAQRVDSLGTPQWSTNGGTALPTATPIGARPKPTVTPTP